jgi:hypothetical protein
MEELIVQAGNPQLPLYLHAIAAMYHGCVSFNSKNLEYHSNRCLQLYYATQMQQKRLNNGIEPILLVEGGGDVAVLTLMMQARGKGALGQIDKASVIWEQASTLAKVSLYLPQR